MLKNLKFLPKPLFFKIRYNAYTGKRLNLKNSVEINEKKNWLKLYYHPPILTQLADKYTVRSYVAEKIGHEYLNELYGYYQKVEEIDFDKLPNQFILKAVHASHKNLIVTDKNTLNIEETKKTLHKWLAYNQYQKVGFEWAYKNIKPAIIAEKLLKEDQKRFLTDYKFVCMLGKVIYVQIVLDVDGKEVQVNYNKAFEQEKFIAINREWYQGAIEKPVLFDKMVALAEILADRFPYVRIDFYQIENKIIFGEVTFYPGDGKYEFFPDEYNKIIGDQLQLPKMVNGQKEITIY
ncbi:MAG: glycosyltransferase [Flavobacteriaceae bacterium]|nr:glycosyltransferase [Flavobacteriaceae bacterium]